MEEHLRDVLQSCSQDKLHLGVRGNMLTEIRSNKGGLLGPYFPQGAKLEVSE